MGEVAVIGWPCGCTTWRQGGQLVIDWCQDMHCEVYESVIAERRLHKEQVRFISQPDLERISHE
jgi:hypothetical protein